MSYTKYRIRKRTSEDGSVCYIPQIKEGLFRKWRGTFYFGSNEYLNFPYETYQEAIEVINEDKELRVNKKYTFENIYI